MRFRQLHPVEASADPAELLTEAALAERAPAGRPYVIANFIASADGRASFAGRSGALSDAGDRHLFHTLREHADAILVGTATARIERYGRAIRDEQRRARRAALGRAPEPPMALVTRTGRLPLEIPLFAEPEAEVIVATAAASVDTTGSAARVEVVRPAGGETIFGAVLRDLRERCGARLVLCEGGPQVTSMLLHEGLLDELFLTIAPKLTGGGTGPAVTTGPELPEPAALALRWALEREGTIFLRYEIARG